MLLKLVVGANTFEFNGRIEDFEKVRAALDGWFQAIAIGATPAEQAALATRAGAAADKLEAADQALKKLGKS